jgi:excisionase family DNA binding protein
MSQALEPKLLLSVKETADLCGVSVDSVYRWISKGVDGHRLRTVHTGQTYVRRKAIDEFLDALERPAAKRRS